MWFVVWLMFVLLLAGCWLAPDFWVRYVYPRVRVHAEISLDIADLGELLEIRITVSNPARLPCPRLRLDFQLPEELELADSPGEHTVRLETYVLGRQRAELAIDVRAARRGVARWNQATLEFSDMLGLRSHVRTVYPELEAIVRPERLGLSEQRFLPEGLTGDIRVNRHFQEDTSLLLGVRPYQRTDSLRSIHWFATARTGELMVKQYGYSTESRMILLMNGQMSSSYWAAASRERLDRLCERALQVAGQLLASGARVAFMSNLSDYLKGGAEIPAAPGAVQTERIANRLGSLTRFSFCSLAELLREAGRSTVLGDTVVLVTDYEDAESRHALAELGRSCRVHIISPLTPVGEPSGEEVV